MNDGYERHGICRDPVDEAIAVDDHLTDRRLIRFGNNASRVWKLLQPSPGSDQLPNHRACVGRGVTVDVRGDRLDVAKRFFRPGLLGEPSLQPCFCLILGEGGLRFCRLDASTHLLQDIEVVLDVFKRAVLGEATEEGLNLFLRGAHQHLGDIREKVRRNFG